IVPPVDSATTDLTTDVADTPATTINESPAAVSQVVPLGGVSQSGVDYGDLPQTYFTLLNGSPNGPRHVIPAVPNLYLGANPPDAEGDGVPSIFADGDDLSGTDDEDGVINFSILPDAGADGFDDGSVEVTVNGSGYLVAWVDFNNDGDFA